MILIIDNYDSFTFNLYQLIGSINPDVCVERNDKITISEIKAMNLTHIVLSPGPGYPEQAGICKKLIKEFEGRVPILGVCLGHQAIGEVFGGQVIKAVRPVHGKQSEIVLTQSSLLFKGLPKKIKVARYHSLVIANNTFPKCLLKLAETAEGEVMAIKHCDFELYGVQFHPESIMTLEGMLILQNFLKIKEGENNDSVKH
ncbi:MAG TPA: aminodeoxychorismate/anthranilate synthase component II [Candidatus Avacidaminococcus intestinavium]|uniref:Aminodeoxychorismate/anthranilate synthase component II n=1 Tax=Candidatus Avacidaminococcus intestinavium TaxID=2840684 RepID=A0A9D1MQ09_9FIRM|nr:aminodeoxychorismate/anthranilate synthase component II [Candidatus Avacidaminococcus intestinavium]